MTARAATIRPALRGYIHFAAAMAAPFALLVMLLYASSPRAYVGAAIFGAGLVLLFTTSTVYHLVPWGSRARAFVGRLDHSVIFLAIAAMYTPFCLQALGNAWGIPILAVVWSLAGLGAVTKLVFPRLPRAFSVALYLAVGWMALVTAWPLFASLGWFPSATLLAAGLVFSAGAAAYATRWPNPSPRIFGHHEVFHSLVTLGAGLIYLVVIAEVLPS